MRCPLASSSSMGKGAPSASNCTIAAASPPPSSLLLLLLLVLLLLSMALSRPVLSLFGLVVDESSCAAACCGLISPSASVSSFLFLFLSLFGGKDVCVR
jgi:hypothetical protein